MKTASCGITLSPSQMRTTTQQPHMSYLKTRLTQLRAGANGIFKIESLIVEYVKSLGAFFGFSAVFTRTCRTRCKLLQVVFDLAAFSDNLSVDRQT